MKANFDKLRLRYKRDATAPGVTPVLTAVDIVMELTSLNFDINQTVIGKEVPFTTELSFNLKVDTTDRPLAVTTFPIAGQNVDLDLRKADDFTKFLQDAVFIADNAPTIGYWNMETGGELPTPANAAFRHASVTVQSFTDEGTLGSSWLVQLKFLGQVADPENKPNPDSVVLFPQLMFDNVESFLQPENGVDEDSLLEFFNIELKGNFELLLLPTNNDPNTNVIGKVADEIADSFVNLGNTIAGKLSNTINARLQPVAGQISYDLALWSIIKMGTEDLSFGNFLNYMDLIFCTPSQSGKLGKTKDKLELLSRNRATPFMGVDAYHTVKVATEAFVMVNCMTDSLFDTESLNDLNKNVPLVNGVPDTKQFEEWWKKYKERLNGAGDVIPYLAVIQRKLKDSTFKAHSLADAFQQAIRPDEEYKDDVNCYGILSEKLTNPCFLELIWSYWHEESMMVQGMNAIGRRFQNIKGPGTVDPLANLEIDPLRPLSNLLWGYLQDEQHRLTVRRRAYEYDHHYGISLQGTAVRNMRFADSRSKFIEAFHTLLHLTSKFYKQADDMTVQPDSFPVLNALKEVHLILSEGAHNQYGDLPSVARAEMLMQQWLLARPEFREFLPTRIMVAYPEPWMDRVSALNNLMGWTKTSVMHFHDLGVFGEQLLLSIRFGNWASVNDRHSASNWANFWRSQVQSYIHAYRTVTGVDLTADVPGARIDALQPSVHLQRRLMEQRGGKVA